MWHKDSYWGLRKIRKHRPRSLAARPWNRLQGLGKKLGDSYSWGCFHMIFFWGLKHSLSFLEGMTPYFFEILWNSASQDLHRYGKTVWFQKKNDLQMVRQVDYLCYVLLDGCHVLGGPNQQHPRMVHAAVLSTRDGARHGAHLHLIWLAVLDQRYRASGSLGQFGTGE